ncbi:MAG: hypothetical protein SVZ03_04695 [Spirochaetota bacterium]|nr:hypothetical protein [Spirochaetota bacterium]
MEFLRIWSEVDIKDIEDKILIVDDMFGYCPGCKEIGIKLTDIKQCPNCKREVKYITSKDAKGGAKSHEIVIRMKRKLPNLTFVDYEDYERATSKKKGEGLFKI